MLNKPLLKDEWGIVIDFLAHGHVGMERSEPVAYVVGDQYFSLLEVILREDISMKIGDRVYIGDGKRQEVKYIRKRIGYDELTAGAKGELEDILDSIVMKNEKRFVDFFNSSGPVNTRLHQLELLPGIGRRHLWEILGQRKQGKFGSFGDMKKKLPLLPHPEKIIVKRVLLELHDGDKYRIFVPRFEAGAGRR
jgi:putative nucleotide binding protein